MTTAMFSILAPGEHIPHHRGPYKGVLRHHLGLIVPEPAQACRIRVSDEVRHWAEGESLLFDDTHDREVWNDTGWIIRRSSALFVLTSTASVVTAIAAGGLALAGLGGPWDVLHGGLPVLAGCTVIGVVVALARRSRPARRKLTRAAYAGELLDGVADAGALLVRPSWRVSAAASYLWFDIAALWAAFDAIGRAPPLVALVLGYLIGFLVYALPVPGAIGVLDAGLAGALALYGVPAVHGAAAVLVYHAVAPVGAGRRRPHRLRRRAAPARLQAGLRHEYRVERLRSSL